MTNRQAIATDFTATARGAGSDFLVQITPSNFTLAPGANQVMNISVTVINDLPALPAFLDIPLTSNTVDIPDAHFTAVIVPTGFLDINIFTDGFESGDTMAWASTTP